MDDECGAVGGKTGRRNGYLSKTYCSGFVHHKFHKP
jgi:hypothetical protein